MSSVMQSTIDYRALVREDEVHGTLYSDPAVFADELERIFYRGWVYVGHESEVPRAGDYCVKMIGLQTVVLTRDEKGNCHVLYDRCPHRANRVTQKERGNAQDLTCAYHGWSFSMSGELTGLPYASGYAVDFDRSKASMAKVARMDSYGGFVFASLAPAGISLDEHLGNGKRMIDELTGLSPTGRVELSAGWMKQRILGNWKNILENQVDGYHATIVHSTLLRAKQNWAKERDRKDVSPTRIEDLGLGHSNVDYGPLYRSKGKTLGWTGGVEESRLPNYVAAMKAAYGEGEATRRLIDGPPHAMIFPNLFIAEMNVMVLLPTSEGETIHCTTPVMLEGGAELNARSLRRCEGALGPAGFLITDDAELSETGQIGAANRHPEWLILKRGLESEEVRPDGTRVAGLMDETGQRAFWRHYREVMSEGAIPPIPGRARS